MRLFFYLNHRCSGLISFILIILFILPCAFGQEPGVIKPGQVEFEPVLEEFSLPDYNEGSTVFLQDSKGFLWLSHKGAFFRYDGYGLKEFLEVPVGRDDLYANNIATMAEDEFGNIWIGCLRREGVYRYDPRKETFQRFPRDKNDPREISDTEVWSISPDRNGRVWIATTGYGRGRGLYVYSYETDSVTEFRYNPRNPSGIPSDYIQMVHADPDGNVWIDSYSPEVDDMRLYHFREEEGIFREVRLEQPGEDPLAIETMDIQEDGAGSFIFFAELKDSGQEHSTSLIRMEKTGFTVMDSLVIVNCCTLVPDFPFIHHLGLDKRGTIWFTLGYRGIGRLQFSSGTAETYQPFDPSKGGQYWFSHVVCDGSGSVWYSYVQGMKRFSPAKRKFAFYGKEFFGLDQEDELTVYSVYEAPDGMLWMIVNEKLASFNPGTGLLSYHSIGKGYQDNPIRWSLIIPGDEGELLVAGENHLCRFQMEDEKFQIIRFPETIQNIGGRIPAFKMIRDREGLVWIGTDPGCIRVDPEKETKEFLYDDNGGEKYTGGTTRGVVEDRKGMIWLGTEFGLNRVDPVTGDVTQIVHDLDHANGLSSPNIETMIQDSQGNLWIGHTSHGISFLGAKYVDQGNLPGDSMFFEHYSLEDGLPDLHIHAMVEDPLGEIWIATSKGLSRLDPETRTITTYGEQEGIHLDRFTGLFFRNPSTGKIYIGGEGGMISFQPDSLPVNNAVPKVVLTGFRLHDRPVPISDTSVLKQSISYTDRLDLSYRENFLEFTFAALDFTIPEKNQYKYFMKGVDQDTVFAGTDRTAEYRDLRPGKYLFWVTGSNNDGVWNPEGISLEIRIHPPWYRSGLAEGSYLILLILMVAGFIQYRTARLRKEKVILEGEVARRTEEIRLKNEQIVEMERMKTRFFTDVSHEIRTPVSLISGPLDNLMEQDHPDPSTGRWLNMIRRNSSRLLQLVNQLLDISKLDSGQMKLILEESDLMKHLRVLVHEYLSLAESRKIRFIIDLPGEELVTWYDSEKVERITTNLLSNAFKYTPEEGTVTCRVKILKRGEALHHRELRMLVADTGPGIPWEEREKIFSRFYRAERKLHEDAGGTGIGLSLTRELVTLMKGEITLKSLEGKGSVFVVTLPLGTEHLNATEYILKQPGADQVTEEPAGEESDRSASSETITGQGMEVLVIEDNPDLRTFIRENLISSYKISEAEDGIMGLELARSEIPDLIITDLMMPGMDGLELCRRLKNNEHTSHIPILILTAKSTGKEKIEGLKTGADDYIFKPFSMDELKARIRNILVQRERLKKKYSSMIGVDWDKISVTTLDEKFLKKVTGVVSENMLDLDFNVGRLQEKMAMSREHLFRKLKALTGDSPSSLIRTMRLKTAASLMEKGETNVARIALNSGFSNLSSFNESFKNYFGKTPRGYIKGIRK